MSMPGKTYFRLVAEGQMNDWKTRALSPVLHVASAIYGQVNATTRGLYEKKILKTKRLPIPVISVGNLTWGGSGKTPLVEYLARRIAERAKKPLILMRGYSQDEVEQMKHRPLIGDAAINILDDEPAGGLARGGGPVLGEVSRRDRLRA